MDYDGNKLSSDNIPFGLIVDSFQNRPKIIPDIRGVIPFDIYDSLFRCAQDIGSDSSPNEIKKGHTRKNFSKKNKK